MKQLLLVVAMILCVVHLFGQTNFTRGFQAGYKKGYCYNQGVGCVDPITPMSPIPRVGESLNSYQDGYNTGFDAGLSARTNNTNKSKYTTASAEPLEYTQRINTAKIAYKAQVLKDAKAKAFELSSSGNYQGSIDIGKAGLSALPNDSEFLMIIGSGYLKLRNYSEALTYLKRADKASSNSGLKKLIVEVESGAFKKKIDENDKNLVGASIEKRSAEMQSIINQHIKDQNYLKALDLANELVKLDNSWESYARRGYIRYLSGSYAESISDFTKSIEIHANPNSYFIRAMAKNALEDYYGCINDYEKIIEGGVAPDNNDMATIYNNKAYALVKLKKFKEALSFVNIAIEKNPNPWYIWDTRGEINFQLGEFKKSIEDMTKALSIKPDANSYYFRGLARIKLGDKTNGCSDLSKSGELGNINAYTEIKSNCK